METTFTEAAIRQVSEKPKRLKPRRALKALSFRLGRFQVEFQIWKWRKI